MDRMKKKQVSKRKDQEPFPESLEDEDSSIVTNFSKLFLWGEKDKLDRTLRNLDAKMPSLMSFLASLAMFLLGITAKGEWVIFAVYFYKFLQTGGSDTYVDESREAMNSFQDWVELRFKNYFSVLIPSIIISYIMYFGFGGYLHWYYYVRQREHPETWKCQPTKWLSPELERNEIILGSTTLAFASIMTAALATYIMNDGTLTKVYFGLGDYGYIWLLLQIPVVFIYQDYLLYWVHRGFHFPWLYKHFHKLHHAYKQPTAFSVTAIHPFEFACMQGATLSAVIVMPVYWINFIMVMIYHFYHGIIDHSGIDFKRHWWQPWQPDAIFHDNHHQYFHVNFAANVWCWDYIHGTYRRKDRIYREDIFYGSGKAFDEATPEELINEMEERNSENPSAYRDDDLAPFRQAPSTLNQKLN